MLEKVKYKYFVTQSVMVPFHSDVVFFLIVCIAAGVIGSASVFVFLCGSEYLIKSGSHRVVVLLPRTNYSTESGYKALISIGLIAAITSHGEMTG